MDAAIVTIGDEILIGQITDTNSVWMARELTAVGISVQQMLSISDSREAIEGTLNGLIGNIDLVLITGGLGPTKDDLTKEVLNDYFDGKLVMHEEVLKRIEQFFKERGRTMLESNQNQALLPDTCKVIHNGYGTASGMWFSKEGTQVISMPGVPYEMKPMVTGYILPALKQNFDVPELVHKTVMTHGVPESFLAVTIRDWEEALPECLKLAYLPRPGIVRLRLTVTGKCAANAEKMLAEQIEELHKIIGEHIFGYDDVFLEEAIGKLLTEKGLSLATAESSTGGNIARLITSVPGSSAYFLGSVIAYSNEVKISALDVPEELILEHGAVSGQVVEEMAVGAMRRLGTSTAIATSGVAGPGGGTPDKPVGTVWIAVAYDQKVYSKLYKFGGHRELVIEQASMAALGLLRKLVLGAL